MKKINSEGVGSRVERYSRKNRLKRTVKRTLKNTVVNLLKNIIYLIVGLSYSLYLLIRSFNNLVAKLFMKLPRIMKVLIIYLLVANVGINIYKTFNYEDLEQKIVHVRELNSIKQPQNTTTLEETTQIETKQEEEYECTLDEVSCLIKQKSSEYDVEEYANLFIAISKHETGNYTSRAFKELNNVGGMMCNSGLIKYNSLEEGIEAFVKNLKYNYIDLGLNTIEKIQPKYCPIGAANDPKGLNKYWVSGVNKYYNELEK